MQFIVKTTPEELLRARNWWANLEVQWKFAYNEALFGKGPVLEPPNDDFLMMLLVGIDTMRFAGPFAPHPNMSMVLTNLSGLIPVYNLVTLSLTNMNVTSIAELTYFKKIENLFLYDNKITSLQGIENLSQLKNLYLQNNEISDLSILSNLKNLEVIYLSNNKIKSLKTFNPTKLKKLKKFHILPNDEMPDKEIIQFQNKYGIICRNG